jgi:hypothetical protein
MSATAVRQFLGSVSDDSTPKDAHFSADGKQLLDDFVAAGRLKLVCTNASTSRQAEAAANLRRFIAALTAEGTKSGGGTPLIDEKVFIKVYSSLCPLYPFC